MTIPSETPLFIAGQWVAAHGEPFTTLDPSTGARLWSGRAASTEQVVESVRAARDAFHAWASRPVAEREGVLRRFAGLVGEQAAELTEVVALESGKPRWEAASEIASVIAKIPLAIQAHARRCGEFRGGPATTRFRPYGVFAVLGPYNFPAHLPNGHVAPALLAGNTVVFKPSELTPWTAERMVELWRRAELPAGVLNLIQGGRAIGQALASRAEIDGLLFTGSAQNGASLHRLFADHPEKLLVLEMGGNNPLVVTEVQDLDAAALLTIQSAYLTAGQRCTCARRLIVPRGELGDRFLARLAATIPRVRVGAPSARPEPFMGPVIRPEVAASLLALERRLRDRGGTVLVPMRHLMPETGLLTPGLVDVTDVAVRDDEEHMGPLLQVIRVSDLEAAIAEANHTRYGLAAGLLSDRREHWEQFFLQARAGVVNWNRPLTGASSAAPFGGIGLSGNQRPSGYFAADYCAYPVASIEHPEVAMTQLVPGVEGAASDGND